MSNHHFEPKEQNTGTYQTGVTPRERRSSGLIAVLLVLTIFLGGLASALGILNIQLLNALMQQPDPTVPVDIQSNPSATTASGSTLDGNTPAPLIPDTFGDFLQLQPVPEQAPVLTQQQIYTRNLHSLVVVQSGDRNLMQEGVGLVISQNGFILTNAHLVDSASHLYVTTAEGIMYRASLVGSDVLTDLAVLYIAAENLIPADFGDSQQLTEAQSISATCGTNSMKSGMITDPDARISASFNRIQLMQTTMGSCEGPTFNSYGQVVGFHSQSAPTHFGLYTESDLGFAIPSTTVQTVVNELLEFGYVRNRPTLGIETEAITRVYQKYWDLPGGLRLTEICEKAKQQGLQEGDILMALDGHRISDEADLYRVLFSGQIGQSLTAIIFRDGASYTVAMRIFEMAECV